MRRGPDAATLVERALRAGAAAIGVAIAVECATSVRWASATFTGRRHTLDLTGNGGAAAAWLGDLPDAEFAIRGHLVADAVVVRSVVTCDAFSAKIELLTVEEC